MLIRIVEEQGEVTKIVGRGSKKKSYRSRSTSASSQDSFSSGSYTGNYKVISHRYLSVDLITTMLFQFYNKSMYHIFQEVVQMKTRPHQGNEFKRIRRDSMSFASEESSRYLIFLQVLIVIKD